MTDRRLAASALVALLAATVLAVPARAESHDSTPKFPHVAWHEDPAHEATIVWHTQEPGEVHRVHWDVRSRDGEVAAYANTTEAARHVEEFERNAHFHHVELTGLHPATTYHFVVESDGEATREYRFDTAPADDRPITLLYGGDSRTDRDSRRAMNDRLRELHTSEERIIGLVHGGDYVDVSMNWSDWQGWLEDWMRTVSDDGRMLPVVPARGNHEFSINQLEDAPDNYNAVWGMPGGSERDHWLTRFGSQIGLLNLDSNTTLGGDQRDWLESRLQELTESRRWILANYHRPAYPAVKEPGGAQAHWVPLFEEYRVDLVCESDGHVLKRTVPILDGEQHPDGIVYVGEGGLGVEQRSPESDRWYLQEPGVTKSAHHVQRLDFDGDELTYRALGVDGEVLDEKVLEARREAAPDPLELSSAEVTGPSDDGDGHRLTLAFSKGVAAESVASPEAFSIEPTVEVREAQRHPHFDDRVRLEIGPLGEDASYTVRAEGIEDLRGGTIDGDEAGTATFGLHDGGGDEADAGADVSDATDASPESPPDPSEADNDDGGSGCASGPRPRPFAGAALLLLAMAWRRGSSRRA